MAHLGTAAVLEPARDAGTISDLLTTTRQCVLIVRDATRNNNILDSVCGFLDIDAEHISDDDDLTPMLLLTRPIAVIADLESEAQDGFHVMKVAACYDRDLPVLLLTEDDPVLLGAVDAMREISGLTSVGVIAGDTGVGPLIDFLCHAARGAGMSGLMRV